MGNGRNPAVAATAGNQLLPSDDEGSDKDEEEEDGDLD